MELKVRNVAVFSTAFGASGDLIDNILIGTKGLSNQGLCKVGGMPPFVFKNVAFYSRLINFVSAVKGVYTYTPGISTTISNVSTRFNINGLDSNRPNAERGMNDVLISVGASESLTNAQYCARVVEAFEGNRFYTAATSGSGGSMVVLLTEKYGISPANKNPVIVSIGIVDAIPGSTFAKTTEAVAQVSYKGSELAALLAEEGNEIVPVYFGGLDTAANYDMYEITFSRREINQPFSFANNKPYKYQIFVKDGLTNQSVFNTKLDALFDINASAFVPTAFACAFTDSGDLVTPTDSTKTPLNNDVVTFATIDTTTGISVNTNYFVVGRTATTFQVSATKGGSAIALSTNGTGTFTTPFYGGDATADTLFAIPGIDSGDSLSA